ncbi:MAG: hypothetical protein D6711_00445 [Chloroflexi bacterium]|nr:MAG: hypothetical protein D6711_00445 [Chloroflexota bacterium]
MVRRITLRVDDKLYWQAHKHAAITGRSLEDILNDWLVSVMDNIPIEQLSNDEVLSLCNFKLNPMQEAELRRLLNAQTLTSQENARLDELLKVYRRGIIRKHQALQVASARGLMVL